MITRATIDDFVSQRTLAVVGVSRSGKKFGNAAARELRQKGFRVVLVHPEAQSIDGERCYGSLLELPEKVGGVLVVTSPSQTEKVARDAVAAGITRIWMQQGAQSEAAIRYCEEQGVQVIHGECILMFAEPTGVHKIHRFLRRLLGKGPR